MTDIESLVRGVYAALGTGDRPALESLLDKDFHGWFTESLPAPIGGDHHGAAACIEDGWWAIGARWRMIAGPEEFIGGVDGSLTVLGTYQGSARSTHRPVTAGFAHHWTAAGDRLTSLRQYTDSAAWLAALEPAADAEATG